MELTILGANGTYPTAAHACSGYLLEQGGFRLWMDLGSGTMSALQRGCALPDVDAVFLSHTHPDHCADIYPFFYWQLLHERTVPCFTPPGARDKLGALIGDDSAEAWGKLLDWRELIPGETAETGPFRIEAFDSVHSARNVTLRVECEGRVFCYSGDTGPNDDLPRAANGADLFLCEASWLDADEGIMAPIHLKASEAGRYGRQAGVGRLMLTHIWPRNDLDVVEEQASATFGGEVELAIRTDRTVV